MPSKKACNQTIESRPNALTTSPDSKVPTMKATEPAPRTHPYSNPRRPLLGGGEADPKASASAKMVIGASDAACKRLIPRKAQKSMAHEIAQRHRGGEYDADNEYDAERMGQVADATCKRRTEQSHGRASAEHEAKLLGQQPPRT